MNDMKKAIIKTIIWTTIRIGVIVFMFGEVSKIVPYAGGIVAFFIYIFITEYIWEKTQFIDKAIAKDIGKLKDQMGEGIEKKAGKRGKEFWKGFSAPMRFVNTGDDHDDKTKD